LHHRGYFIAVIIGVSIWLIVIFLSTEVGCYTYYQTPNITDFESFATHGRTFGQSKDFYLFFPALFALICGSIFLMSPPITNLLGPLPNRAVLLGMMAVLFLAVAHQHSSRALEAAKSISWQGSAQSDALVGIICHWRVR
jgi:hypothetical protein